MLHIPILAHIHEMEYTFRQYKIKKEIIQQCDSFIAVSSTVASTLESYGTKKEKIKGDKQNKVSNDNNSIKKKKLLGHSRQGVCIHCVW